MVLMQHTEYNLLHQFHLDQNKLLMTNDWTAKWNIGGILSNLVAQGSCKSHVQKRKLLVSKAWTATNFPLFNFQVDPLPFWIDCGIGGGGQSLARAMKSHYVLDPSTGRKTYHCSLCDIKPFLTRSGLRSHKKMKHGLQGAQYRCPFCQKPLAATNQFRGHLREHGGNGAEFFCYLCRGSFEKVGEFLENVQSCLAAAESNGGM